MDEYIKREDTINVINQRIKNDLITGWLNRIIYTVPDADVVEVRHGQWELDDGRSHCHCTNCLFGRNIETQIGWHYCPNCGARMDKGE